MTNGTPTRSYRPFVAALLSLFLCGLGHLYLHRPIKGLILILACCFAIVIIWIGLSDKEFKVVEWDKKELMFSPSRKSISFRDHTFRVSDIMKVTGTIQLAFTWIFGIADAWRKGKV
jgi:hypothetical protein